MQTIEVTAKSVDEAKQQAAKKLGVSIDQLSVDVLEQTKGLFGRGSVKIRASAATPQAESAPAEVAPVVEAPVAPPAKPASRAKAPARAAEPEEAPAEEFATNGHAEEPEASGTAVATQADADFIVGMLSSLLSSAQIDVKPEIGQIAGKYVTIVIDGKDSSFLVGKHGEVINALQYLVNIIVNQQLHNGVRATLDCNNYRQRREEALTKLAQSIAEQVQTRGEEAVLDALPAFERRVVHKALSEFGGVTTYSEGEEPNRRVVIAPAD